MNEKEFVALTPTEGFCTLVRLAAERGVLKRVALSGSTDPARKKAQLIARTIGGHTMLQLETFYTDNKARHQNVEMDDMQTLAMAFADYRQANLSVMLTSDGAELKRAASGKQTLLRGVKLLRALASADAVSAPTPSGDKVKNRILSGGELFLRALGVSDESGRVHDKKQSKFRQINRFLELLRDVEQHLPDDGVLRVCDLCCGKSYLSFAVYHYLTAVKGRKVVMECVDLKPDVIEECSAIARRLGFDGLHFICGDVAAFEPSGGEHVHLVVSLHACDTATDLVLGKAMAWQSEVILSTPCCHHELTHTLDCPELACIAEHSMLRQKLCDAATDAMRLLLLKSRGYAAIALELIDPEETPKNVMLRAVKNKKSNPAALAAARAEYEAAVRFFIRSEGAGQQAFLDRGKK